MRSAISILHWIMGTIKLPIDYKKVLGTTTFLYSLSSSVIIFLIQNFDLDQYDIDKICREHWAHSKHTLEFQLCILETYGSELVDVKSVFENVCKFISAKEVKWLMSRVDNKLLDFTQAIKEAMYNNNDEIFVYLFEFVNVNDQNVVNEIFIAACCYGDLRHAEFIHDKYMEYLSIPEAIHELCNKETLTQPHFDVF